MSETARKYIIIIIIIIIIIFIMPQSLLKELKAKTMENILFSQSVSGKTTATIFISESMQESLQSRKCLHFSSTATQHRRSNGNAVFISEAPTRRVVSIQLWYFPLCSLCRIFDAKWK